MKIPPYWTRARYDGRDRQGREWSFTGVGWSFESLQDAKALALARARRIFDRFARGEIPDRYDYRDTPIREEILEEVRSRDSVVAVITRNRYGAKVLNCSQVLFVDIDFPLPKPPGLVEMVLLAFSRAKREARRAKGVESTLKRVESWIAANGNPGLRVYRTRGGLRILFTDRLHDPNDPRTTAIFTALGADPLYVRLTQKQECFRARLSVKPWRCGATRPPGSFPREDDSSRRAFHRWLEDYEKRDACYKVCDLIWEAGPPASDAAIKAIVAIHDRETRLNGDGELA